MKKVLLVAYHFPPIRVSSGIQRTLSMARYLKERDWEPVILSISPRAYENCSNDQLKDIPEGINVYRAFGLDTARHLSIKGRYPGALALPDRWITWAPAALMLGWQLVKQVKPDLIWSTYPIATAHLVGLGLDKVNRAPWVADFRDSMVDDIYPVDQRRRKVHSWIERKAIEHAAKVVFTAPGTQRMYEERYPDCDTSKFAVIPNGFDEDIFQSAEARVDQSTPSLEPRPITLLHAGVLYPSERDPTAFFDAVAELKSEKSISLQSIQIVLRATGHDHLFQPMLEQRDIEDIVTLAPGVAYEQALAEMLNVDGLLLFQAANCNHQIPAKLYEYFRTGKPILALTDAQGDTAKQLLAAGVESVFALDNKNEIKTALTNFLNDASCKSALSASRESANAFSRQALVHRYAELFDAVLAKRSSS